MKPGKRALLVETALELIRHDGLGALSQSRVAGLAGMRQSHLTYYFPTRADLLRAVTDEAIDQRAKALDSANAEENEERKLDAFAAVFTDPGQTRLLLALVQSADSDPDVRQAFETLTARIRSLTRSLLEFLDVPETSETLALVQAAGTGISVLALSSSQAPSVARAQARALLSVLFDALRARSLGAPSLAAGLD